MAQRRYTAEDIEAGLHALAIANGNHRIAARLLTENERDIPAATLYGWKTGKHTARYEEIQRDILPEIHEKMATESEALAIAYAQIEREALERLNDRFGELKAGELAQVATRIATSRGISVDKARLMRDLPTEIHEQRNADEILRKLGTAVQGLVIDGTAQEIEQPALPPKSPAIPTEQDQ